MPPDVATAAVAAPEVTSGWALDQSRILEIAAVILLGAGTIIAAWSGYQAARWNGIQSADYVHGSGERVEATNDTTQAGQERLYDSQVFSQWLNADDAGNTKLANIYLRRFRPEFTVAFDAWLKTDPFTNPSAPPGPLFMPEYVQASAQSAGAHEAQAETLINAGQDAEETSNSFILHTVIFATVLFLAAASDRFKWPPTRIAVLGLGTVLLLYGLVGLVQLPSA